MIRIMSVERHEWLLHTRMPFRYGIAALTEAPHVVLHLRATIDGHLAEGWAADILPPKWFTKDPHTTFADDLLAMRAVIEHACRAAETMEADSVFDLWWMLHEAQAAWAAPLSHPPLLWHFGVSLVERAAIDAFCRHRAVPFHQALRHGLFGIRLGQVRGSLEGLSPRELLPKSQPRSMIVRHTVGLSDPLTDTDIPLDQRLDDGLPQSLEACIGAYGLTHFKIKLGGDHDHDMSRLLQLGRLLGAGRGDYLYTLDGNEQFASVQSFREFWEAARREPRLAHFLSRLIFVEQPLARSIALNDQARDALLAWTARPPMIIDESDGDLDALPRALAAGYVGTSHKNCKGVFKGVANACLLHMLRRERPDGVYVLSGEDLANVGPLALLQDLAVAAALGVEHAERNGHHYFRGLAMFPPAVQQQTLAHHPDLYRPHERGFATLRIERGQMALRSVTHAPFGFAGSPQELTPVHGA